MTPFAMRRGDARPTVPGCSLVDEMYPNVLFGCFRCPSIVECYFQYLTAVSQTHEQCIRNAPGALRLHWAGRGQAGPLEPPQTRGVVERGSKGHTPISSIEMPGILAPIY